MKMRNLCSMGLVVLALVAAASAAALGTRADTPLQAFAERYLAWRLAEYPEWATAMGDHQRDDHLRDMSAAAVARRDAANRRFAAELTTIDPSRLDLSDRVDREVLLNQLELDHVRDVVMRTWRDDPLLYTNIASDSVYDLLKRDYAPIDVRLRAAISRMRGLPTLLAQARINLDNPPRIKTEIAISQTAGALSLFREAVNVAAKGTPVEAEVAEAARTATTALEDYRAWLSADLLPRSRDEWRLGPERYDQLFTLESGSTMSPLEALRRAEADFEATRNRIRTIATKNWSTFKPNVRQPDDPDQAVSEVMQAIADAHPAPEEFIPALERAAADLKRFIIEKHILDLPEPDTLTIQPTPDFQAGLFHGQLDQSPPLSSDPASIYTTSGSRPNPGPDGEARLVDFLREFNNKALVNLITHEGYPGHYVQGRYAARCPSLTRKVFMDGSTVEGWACYTEAMMLQEGFGGGDPGLELQMLKMQLKMMANVMLDIGLHRGQMREDEVVPFLVNRAFQTPGEARAKLVRAKGTAVQLSTYYLGYVEMWDLRRDYQAKVGPAFTLRDYHHKVLEAGAPPMRYLRELILSGRH
jgi:uncharacterized protein (DUF885 family)